MKTEMNERSKRGSCRDDCSVFHTPKFYKTKNIYMVSQYSLFFSSYLFSSNIREIGIFDDSLPVSQPFHIFHLFFLLLQGPKNIFQDLFPVFFPCIFQCFSSTFPVLFQFHTHKNSVILTRVATYFSSFFSSFFFGFFFFSRTFYISFQS